jgi:hypothetical protein
VCAAARVEPAAQPAEQVDDLAAGEVGPQRDVAGHVRQPPVQRGRVAPRVAAQQPRGTPVGAQQAQQDPDGGGLAGSVGAEEAVHLPGAHGEVEPVQGPGRAVCLGEPRHGDGVGHCALL